MLVAIQARIKTSLRDGAPISQKLHAHHFPSRDIVHIIKLEIAKEDQLSYMVHSSVWVIRHLIQIRLLHVAGISLANQAL